MNKYLLYKLKNNNINKNKNEIYEQPFMNYIDKNLNPKEKFRIICNNNIEYIRNIMLPDIKTNLKYEAVLIEYRCFPHLEFLIRNTIIKLGNEWSHTIVCGNLNFEFISNLCLSISPNINIIKTDYDNLNQSTYSILLSTIEFWNLFKGDKILLYQEDSCIFNSNINDFLIWDYIGAPWLKKQNDTLNSVGNGGFSLRTRQTMIDVINNISINNMQINSSTINYMNNCKMTICPEDVYFSKTIQENKLGLVADWNTAFKFSTETIYNSNSLGGHNFWLSDKLWEQRIYNQTIITFKLYNYTKSDHRGGWNTILDNFYKNKIINDYSDALFLDNVERYFSWFNKKAINKKWSGIIHCTPITPPYLNIMNISLLFKNKDFIKSLDDCYCLFTLSNYVTKFLQKEFIKIKKIIKVFTLKHPIETNSVIPFNLENYFNNPNKKLVQIGQQLRKVTSIYLLSNIKHEKIWLTGTKKIKYCEKLLMNESSYLSVTIPKSIKDSIKMYYTNTIEEYDTILSQNIVFVDLFDAAANNTVLECIVRNTPLIIKKIEGVVEYLGEDYPLYFTKLDQVNDLLKPENIMKAHEYLKNMDKSDIDINYFIKSLINNLMSCK